MKNKTKEYFCSGFKVVAEKMSANEIYLTIHKYKKTSWFWGDVWNAVGSTVCIQFVKGNLHEGSGGTYETMYNGRAMHIPVTKKSIKDFDLWKYCQSMIDDYKKMVDSSKSIEEKVNDLLEIDNDDDY